MAEGAGQNETIVVTWNLPRLSILLRGGFNHSVKLLKLWFSWWWSDWLFSSYLIAFIHLRILHTKLLPPLFHIHLHPSVTTKWLWKKNFRFRSMMVNRMTAEIVCDINVCDYQIVPTNTGIPVSSSKTHWQAAINWLLPLIKSRLLGLNMVVWSNKASGKNFVASSSDHLVCLFIEDKFRVKKKTEWTATWKHPSTYCHCLQLSLITYCVGIISWFTELLDSYLIQLCRIAEIQVWQVIIKADKISLISPSCFICSLLSVQS